MSELEQALLALEVEWPETPDLAEAVQTKITRAGVAGRGVVARRRRWGAGWRRRAALAVAALVLAAGGALAVSPSARSTVSRWLGLDGVVIERGRPSATPARSHALGESLNLGVPITPRQAREAGGLFPGTLPGPDAAYLGPLVAGQRPVALVYAPRPGLPASKVTGVALIVQTFRASLDPILFKKMATDVRETTVRGAPAYWIAGGAHGFMYSTPEGAGGFVPQRLADHTLLVSGATIGCCGSRARSP